MDQGLWTHREAARYLGVTPETLYTWVGRKAGDDPPPSLKLGHFRRYEPDALRAWATRRGSAAS
ncbi:helix-turn-helix domain-containing protein [Cryptosporangium sp. NPDC048952]|uniref:helix-turn-helix domain-containing protein n=1 Tax=Cryptosporangium sp. NPDC048952 TaxID=3363961 RepID=UPI0037191A86